MTTPRTEFLLCNAGYYGTLAAVRSLGRSGVPVITVDPSFTATSRYSRYSRKHLVCPPFELTDKWAEWLLQLGRSGPRRAIYATSDAVSFALARYRDDLGGLLDLYQPNLNTIMCILDKGSLSQHAAAAGLGTPETWLPESIDDAVKTIHRVGGKIVIKPRTQLAISTYAKGAVIDAAKTNGRAEYERLVEPGAHDRDFARQYPQVMLPLLQRYLPQAMDSVLSITGFRDITGAHTIMRGANKVLQQPMHLGVGMCFEEAAVDPALAERITRLCERIGYYGAFELEFIVNDSGPLLIDFNGRFYNQLAFDIARGLDLPRLVYAGATGDKEELRRLTSLIPSATEKGETAYCNSFGLSTTYRLQHALGRISREEAQTWHQWYQSRGGPVIDPVHDDGDRFPVVVDRVRRCWFAVRHARSFVRYTVLAQGARTKPD